MRPIQSTAGQTERQAGGYLAFLPNTLPPHPEISLDLNSAQQMAEVANVLGRLSGHAQALPDPGLFVAMYVRKEALLSSQIENIQSTLDDVLQFEEDPRGNRDAASVVRYVRALNEGLAGLADGGITLALVRRLHEILMPIDPENDDHVPGRFREKQNWIGAKKQPITHAIYVPPPVERMHMALPNLAYYLNEYQDHAPLIKAGIAHAQFETIHPFFDGNGRLGRILISLVLHRDGILEHPVLYPSLYLRDNRTEYYDRLTAVRERGDWIGWLRFFWQAMKVSGEEAIATLGQITTLQSRMQQEIASLPSSTALVAKDLFKHPVTTIGSTKKRVGLSFDAVADALKRLQDIGYLEETTGKKRGKTYRFSKYMAILEGAGENPPGLRHEMRSVS